MTTKDVMTVCTGPRGNLCDHETICYIGQGSCPLCDAEAEIDKLQREAEDLRAKIDSPKAAVVTP